MLIYAKAGSRDPPLSSSKWARDGTIRPGLPYLLHHIIHAKLYKVGGGTSLSFKKVEMAAPSP